MPIRARIPASNVTKSLSMPSLKIVPPVGICETMSRVSLPVIGPQTRPAALDRALQLKRPSLQVQQISGAKALNHDLRAKTAAVRMHNSGIRPVMPKALGAAAAPAAPTPR